MIKLERFVDPSKPASEIANTPVVSCSESDSIRNAIAMTLNGFSRIVVSKGGEMKGFLTSMEMLDFLGAGPRYQLYVRYSKGLGLPVSSIMKTGWHPIDKKQSVMEALRMFQKHGRDFHPIMEKGRFSGIISEMDFLRHLNQPLGIKTGEVMDRKPIVVKSHYTVLDAAKMLCRGEFRFLPVVKDSFIVGVVTPYDIISYLNRGPGLNNLRKTDADSAVAMKRDFLSVEPETDLHEVVRLMNRNSLSGMPVSDEGEMLGLVTRRDVVDLLS